MTRRWIISREGTAFRCRVDPPFETPPRNITLAELDRTHRTLGMARYHAATLNVLLKLSVEDITGVPLDAISRHAAAIRDQADGDEGATS